MFVGEAPGRLGADDTGIPFHGDKAGDNFESLLMIAGINRSDVFITNAVLCNPRDAKGNNSTPNKTEVKNCSYYLKRQIDLIQPKIVVTLGGTALDALSYIEEHAFKLRESVRTSCNWYGRDLIPLYHPGQRAMIHRSYANQRSDYKYISDELRGKSKVRNVVYGKTNNHVSDIVKIVLESVGEISYFGLHKIFYLLEYEALKSMHERITNAYFIRQKDGPYCTDLHIRKLKKALPDLMVSNRRGKLMLSLKQNDLFGENDSAAVSKETSNFVRVMASKFSSVSDAQLKQKAYMTKPMRDILKKEKKENAGMYNVSIF